MSSARVFGLRRLKIELALATQLHEAVHVRHGYLKKANSKAVSSSSGPSRVDTNRLRDVQKAKSPVTGTGLFA
jgi:hypothetical protein